MSHKFRIIIIIILHRNSVELHSVSRNKNKFPFPLFSTHRVRSARCSSECRIFQFPKLWYRITNYLINNRLVRAFVATKLFKHQALNIHDVTIYNKTIAALMVDCSTEQPLPFAKMRILAWHMKVCIDLTSAWNIQNAQWIHIEEQCGATSKLTQKSMARHRVWSHYEKHVFWIQWPKTFFAHTHSHSTNHYFWTVNEYRRKIMFSEGKASA